MSSICPTITSTLAQTLTYCGHCPGGVSSMPTAMIANPTSTYTTTVSAFCSTGLQDATYTVFQSCPCKAAASTAPPPGFTTTVATCTTCGTAPITATMTVPGSSATCIGAGCAPITAGPGFSPASPTGSAGSGPASPTVAVGSAGVPVGSAGGSSPGKPIGASSVPGSPASGNSPAAVASQGSPGAVSQIGDAQPQAPTSAAPASPAGTSGSGSSSAASGSAPAAGASPSGVMFRGAADSTFGSPKRIVIGMAVALSMLHSLL